MCRDQNANMARADIIVVSNGDIGGGSVNKPPQASFTINPNTDFASLTVQLDASASTDDIAKYQWKTSDGQNAEGIKTSLTFSQVGTHNINQTMNYQQTTYVTY